MKKEHKTMEERFDEKFVVWNKRRRKGRSISLPTTPKSPALNTIIPDKIRDFIRSEISLAKEEVKRQIREEIESMKRTYHYECHCDCCSAETCPKHNQEPSGCDCGGDTEGVIDEKLDEVLNLPSLQVENKQNDNHNNKSI